MSYFDYRRGPGFGYCNGFGLGLGRRFGRGYGLGRGYGFGPGYGLRYIDEYDKDRLEFAKRELELRLEYVSKELATHPNDPNLSFVKKEIENRISYINDLLSSAGK